MKSPINVWHMPAAEHRDVLELIETQKRGATPVLPADVGTAAPAAPPARAPGSNSRGTAVKGSPYEDEIRKAATKIFRDCRWTVYDFEQGYRPDACPKCQAPLGRGARTRIPSGIGDQLVVGHGHQVWIEYKRPGMKQSPNQIDFGNDVVANEGHYYVVNDVQQVMAFCRFVFEQGRLPTPDEAGMPARETSL